MQQVFTSASKVMIDAKSGSNLLYLPLDKLMAQSAASDVKTAQPVQPSTAVLPEVAEPSRDSRSRDSETSRDRGNR
jgi:membrane protease subunit HflK